MRAWWGVGAFAGLLAAGAALWLLAAHPAVAVEPAAVDFGRISARATKDVVVRNNGWRVLRIRGVSSSCGCTTATIEATHVPPRRGTRLSITFDPAAHGPEVGPARHAVYVRTDDPRTPEVEIEVRAVVLSRAQR